MIYENPANQNISGSIRVKAPEPWGVSEAPRLISLAASAQQIEPIAIVLRSDATIGKDKIAFDFELEGDRQRKFTVYRTLEIGPEDIIMDVSTRQLSDGRLVIRQEITNTDGGLKQFDCYVYAPGRRRQRRSTSVAVGQTTVQEFIWDNGDELLGKSLLLRVEQQGGERTLNYEFTAVR